MEFIFVLSEWPKKVKTRDDRKACKPGGRKFGIEINFVLFFKYTKATKLNSLRKFILLQSMTKHFFIKFYYFRIFPFFAPPPCLFFFHRSGNTTDFNWCYKCAKSTTAKTQTFITQCHRREVLSPAILCSSFTCVIFSSLHCSPSSAILFPVAFLHQTTTTTKKKKKKKKKKWKAVCVLFNYFSFLLFLILFFL